MTPKLREILFKIKHDVNLMDEVHLLPDHIELAAIKLSMAEWRELAKSVDDCWFCERKVPLKNEQHVVEMEGKIVGVFPCTRGVDKEKSPA